MRAFHEFKEQFIDVTEGVIEKEEITVESVTIDLLSVISYYSFKGMTVVDMISGVQHTLKIEYKEFDKLIRETKLNFLS